VTAVGEVVFIGEQFVVLPPILFTRHACSLR
jgi:hypothetical protein